MKKGEELVLLSKEAVQKEGIEVKVSQGDIIEMLVSERVDEIKTMVQTLNSTHNQLKEGFSAEYQAAIKHHASLVKVPKGTTLNLDKCSATMKSHKSEFTLSHPRNYNEYNTRTTILQYQKDSRRYIDDVHCKGTVPVIKVIEGVQLTGYIEFEFDFKHDPKLVALAKKLEKQVDAFIESMPKEGINETALTKKIKTEFTKQFVKTMSPEFQKSLKKGFGFNM